LRRLPNIGIALANAKGVKNNSEKWRRKWVIRRRKGIVTAAGTGRAWFADILIQGIIVRQEQSITARTACISKPICS